MRKKQVTVIITSLSLTVLLLILLLYHNNWLVGAVKRQAEDVLASVITTVLVSAGSGAVIWLRRYYKQRRQLRLPYHLEFRIGRWTPSVPFILADGVDLDKPRRLSPAEIHCKEVESRFKFPSDLLPYREKIVEAYSREGFLRLTDGQIVRLESFTLVFPRNDEPPEWILSFSPLSYFDFICTNLALTPTFKPVVLPAPVLDVLNKHRADVGQKMTFKEVLDCSHLGNGLTLHLNVVDADNKLLVGRRPKDLPIYGGKLVTSVTGAVSWNDRRCEGVPPDPFLAAVREAREETGIVLNRRHVFFYALGMQADQRHPLLLGAARLEDKLENVLITCRDAWENEVFYYLDLDDLDTCAAVLVYGDWIPASAVAVALSLLDRHG
ncbi:MAG TPA: hypothetical protein GXX19_10905 [Syntrophomonadaceae bacterium]|nr:hypothetical protein [Syntrophomonadaceae bacterium]